MSFDGRAVPFFHVPADAPPPRGRLLLIAPAFPPSATVGALRWQRLAPFLADAGWGLDVITVAPERGITANASGLGELPPGTRVYGVPQPVLTIQHVENVVWGWWQRIRPSRKREVRGAIAHTAIAQATRTDGPWAAARRAYFASTEYALWRGWARRAARLGLTLVKDGLHRAVITSGPPHMVHDGGRAAARRTGLPLLIDLRDPWSLRQTLGEEVASPLWYFLARRFEARAVHAASVVVANTSLVCTRMRSLYATAPGRFVTVMNGSDPEVLPAVERADRFILAFAGSIYLDRDPRPLFSAAARVVKELALSPQDFTIELIGDVAQYGGVPTEELARQTGLAGYVTLGTTRPRPEALAFLARATMLVSLPLDSELTVPAKIFEYVQFNAWLLVLAPPNGATSLLLRGTGADIVAPDDVEGIAAVLLRRYTQFRSGVRPRAIGRIDGFSRAEQARVLIEAIERAVRPSSEPAD